MSKKELDTALNLVASERGNYIIGQALVIAIKSLSEVEEEQREVSNISDMQLLLDNVFFVGKLAKIPNCEIQIEHTEEVGSNG